MRKRSENEKFEPNLTLKLQPVRWLFLHCFFFMSFFDLLILIWSQRNTFRNPTCSQLRVCFKTNDCCFWAVGGKATHRCVKDHQFLPGIEQADLAGRRWTLHIIYHRVAKQVNNLFWNKLKYFIGQKKKKKSEPSSLKWLKNVVVTCDPRRHT